MIALVIIEYSNFIVDQKWSYIIPDYLKKILKVGMRVKVPFKNQIIEGFVLEIKNENDESLKEILDIVDQEPILNNEMIKLGLYMQENLLCTLISAYQTMLPKALKASNKTTINKKIEAFLELNINDFNNLSFGKVGKQLINDLIIYKRVLKKSYNRDSVKKLINEGIIKEVLVEKSRLTYDYIKMPQNIILNDEQTSAVNKVLKHKNESITFLLHGVTGSGKTEVYINIIKDVIKNRKSAIVLVPEISLTPQIINRFQNVFGEQVAILHSHLSDGEKYDEYRKITNNQVSIVIGARSAIFAPFTNLGAIIIDEEHSETYKQENNPKYNTIDIASWRSKYHDCPLILGSATPSIISYAKSLKGIYQLIKINSRPKGAKMPEINLIDMKESYQQHQYLISNVLQERIKEVLLKKQQVMILLNRRGYTPMIMCTSCGYTDKCPNCDVLLTYHKTSNTMRCHYCGYGDKRKTICPTCNQETIIDIGYGTQKLEEKIKELIPEAKVVRMDYDSTTTKGAHQKIINDFNQQKYNILIGTQMIAKGLDFDNVTLVGVVNADSSLNIPDYRSGERTFQLLSQVSGRAGRKNKAGEVIIQSFNKDHYSLKYAAENNYIGFFNEEMTIRKKIGYPPYVNLALVKISSQDYEIIKDESKKMKNYLNNILDKTSIVLGPTTARVFKKNNIYTMQCVIKYKRDPYLLKTLNDILNQYKTKKKVKIDIEFDPLNI